MMKKRFLLTLVLLLLTGCAPAPEIQTAPSTFPETTAAATLAPPATTAALVETVPESAPETTLPPLELTDEEQEMLLKLAMAELGDEECVECLALVMRTVLNRVEEAGFGSSIRGVIYAQDQFTPLTDGSYYRAEPNEACFEALELVVAGWDESQGCLYYEFCEGESWHSKNLTLLFQHCNTRFYK